MNIELKEGAGEIIALRQQLAEKGAEIGRLRKEQEQYGPDKVAIQKQAWVEADRQRQINELRRQLATSQAREQQLREVVWETNRHLDQTYSDLIGHLGCEWLAAEYVDTLSPMLSKALALPQDATAIEAIIAKAGEVMRERCIEYNTRRMITTAAIHALPGVTLEDLK